MSVHITSRAWKTEGLSMTQKIVLVKLADNASDQGQCWPSVPTIAKECSCTERAVYSAIKELERLGHITRRIRSGTSTVYMVNPCTTFTPETDSPLNDIHPTPEPTSPPPLNVVHTTPERRSPKPSRTVKRTIKEPSESLQLPFESEVFKNQWADWITYRKAKRKPVSDHGMKQTFEDFTKWGEEASIESMRKSIKSDWQGLFEPRQSPAGQASNEPRRFAGEMAPTKPFDWRELEAK